MKFFLKVLLGEIQLPSKDEMMEDLNNDIKSRLKDKQRKKDFHKLWKDRADKYFSDLSNLGNLEPIPPVLIKMFTNAFFRALKDIQSFREATYRIIDNENFEVIEHHS